jgi:hypothetical protein
MSTERGDAIMAGEREQSGRLLTQLTLSSLRIAVGRGGDAPGGEVTAAKSGEVGSGGDSDAEHGNVVKRRTRHAVGAGTNEEVGGDTGGGVVGSDAVRSQLGAVSVNVH